MAALIASCSLLLACLWLVGGLLLRACGRAVDQLSAELPAAPPDRGAKPAALSVVVTARDEQRSIEATLRALLSQRLLRLEIIAVDDRSRDATGRIIERLASEAGTGQHTLRPLHVESLPAGWLGKCHAAWVATRVASTPWLLFMDADVELAREDLLAGCLELCRQRELDHLAVIPDTGPGGPLRSALLALFGQLYLLGARAWEQQRDLRRGGGGVGAFNLIRRQAFDRVGGHQAVRLEPAEDYRLGQLLKTAGARQRLMSGRGLVRCDWHRSALELVRGLEKNLFAGLGYSLVHVTAFSLGLLTLHLGPLALLAAGWLWQSGLTPLLAVAPLVQLLVVAAGLGWAGRRFGSSWSALLGYPASVPLLLLAAWNSTLRALWRGGIVWRDSFHSLDELRSAYRLSRAASPATPPPSQPAAPRRPPSS